MDLISVIVPVYKVENFLDECIASIVNQTYSYLEIILIDDGSPDCSGEICDTWAGKDTRIRVIHQKNAGAGKARNAGLAVARGNLIAFVDSDDYLAPRMYESLQCLMDDDTDIVECDYLSTTQDHIFDYANEEKEDITVYSTQEALKEHISDNYFRQLIWNKLYRREVVADIEFPVGKKIDDEFWTYRVLGRARKLVHCNKILYAYRQQPGSVMHTLTAEKRIQAVEAKKLRHEFVKEQFPSLVPQSYSSLVLDCMYQIQRVLQEAAVADRKRIVKYCKNVLSQEYLRKKERKNYSLKQKIWIGLANISLITTCKIRNFLKIGL